MKLLKNTLSFIAIFLTLQTTAQNFSGTITNTDSEVIENAQIVLQYPNAVYENDTVYSDALGFYSVGTTVGIEDLPNIKSSISYQINNNILYISIYKDAINYVSSTGKLYSITGKLIAQCQLIKTTEHKYIGKFQLNNLPNTICIFTDGFYSVKIPLVTVTSRCLSLSKADSQTANNGFDKLSLRNYPNNRSLRSYSKAELVEAKLTKAELAACNGIRLRQAQAPECSEAELVEAGLTENEGRLAQCYTDFDKGLLSRVEMLNLRNVRNNRSLSLSKADSPLAELVEAYHLIINPPNYLPIPSTVPCKIL